MKAIVALFLLAMISPIYAIEPLEFSGRAEEVRFQKLLRELRCLQCQNQSLADSPANVAGGLRQEIHRQMQAGKSNEDIKAFLVERYGEFVLYNPPVKQSTWLLWFGPGAILLLGGFALVQHLRKRGRPQVAALSADDW